MEHVQLAQPDYAPKRARSERASGEEKPPWERIVEAYDYTDESGNLLYQNVRLEDPKDFRQRQPKDRGGWSWSVNGTRRVLYGLPKLLEAPKGSIVLYCEGEKDQGRAEAEGFLATTHSAGAKSFRPEYADALKDQHVVVFFDNDNDGRAGAEKVAEGTHGKAASVKVVELPGLPTGGDLSDYFDAGHTADDLRRLYESTDPYIPTNHKTESNSGNSGNSGKGAQNENEPWEAPAAFHSYDLPQFPEGVLPQWVAAYAKAIAQTTQTPVDLPSMLALNVGATAAAKVAEVHIWGDWREPLNLYTANVLRSGSRKTSTFRAMSKPIEEHEAWLIEETKDEIAQEATRYQVLEESLKKAKTKAAKTQSDEDMAEAISIAQKLANAKMPVAPKLIVDDASPEKLANLLASQGGRIALMSAEGGVFDMMAGRYSQGVPNLDVYLKGHAGDSLRVDRVGRPSDLVKDPALNMALAVQPDVLTGLADKPGFRGRGLIGRFLYSIPSDKLGKRLTKPPAVPELVEKTYAKNMSALYSLAPKLPDDEITPSVLKFSPGAEDVMEVFVSWLEPQLSQRGELGDMTDWAGKLAGAVARIAAVLHLLENTRNPLDGPVGEDTVRRAVEVGHYLLAHAKFALSFMGADPDVQDARYVLRWVEDRALTTFTKRDAWQGTKGRFSKVEELDPALRLLEDHGYIRMRPQDRDRGPGRPPSPTYDVNPLREQSTENNFEPPSQNSHNPHNPPPHAEKF